MANAIKSFPVSAGAYRQSDPRSFLVHACETNADGFPTAVLCNRVKLESILDDACVADEEPVDCRACLAKLRKLAK